MSTFTRLGALAGTTVLLAVPTAVLAPSPAHADVERHGACGGGSYEFSVDREGGGFEVSADVDNVQPGSKWRVVLRHDGKRLAKVVRTADREGDVEVERRARNTAGRDAFAFRAKRIGVAQSCSARVTVR